MIEWCIIGVIAGIVAGLIPGLHSNNISIILFATPFFGTEITAFMLSMCITQSFIEFIPSTFLGAPSENNFESILPLHKLANEGKAFEGIVHCVFGGMIAIIIGSLLTVPFALFLEQTKDQLIIITPIILILALGIFLTEGKTIRKKIIILFILLSAGAQGILFKDQIFPLITGYFGIAGAIISLKEDGIKKTKQITNCEIKKETIIDALIGVAGGGLVSVMPGIGSNTAGGIINLLRKTTDPRKYLTLLGSINASNFFFSFTTLIILSKSRNGTMIALSDKIFYTSETMFIGTLIMIFAAGIGGLTTIILAKKAAEKINFEKMKKMNLIAILAMTLMVLLFNGVNGLVAMIFATALGIYTITKNVRRSTLMSSLIIPTVFFTFLF